MFLYSIIFGSAVLSTLVFILKLIGLFIYTISGDKESDIDNGRTLEIYPLFNAASIAILCWILILVGDWDG